MLFLVGLCAWGQEDARPTQTFPGLLNPAISANGVFLGGLQATDGAIEDPTPAPVPGQGETFGTGLSIGEIEVQFDAAVDPYFKAKVVLALPGGEGVEAEEAFVSLVSVPRLLVNIGKFKQPFGRENLLHRHALPTADRSLIGQAMFGEEGLNDMGVHAAVLLPTPWFSELTVGGDAGNNEVVYGSGEPDGLGAMAHWKNLLDAGSTSVELGLSGLTGRAPGGRTTAEGVDLTVKARGRGPHQFQRLVWQSEGMIAQLPERGEPLAGFYSTLEGSFNKRFWLGGRYDRVGLDADTASQAATAVATLVPTEFSAVRVQAQRQFLPEGHVIDSALAQLTFSIGAHPAHAY